MILETVMKTPKSQIFLRLFLLCGVCVQSLLGLHCAGPIPASEKKVKGRLEITEIMYAGLAADSLEFIEIHNKSGKTQDLAGLQVTSGAMNFTFPTSTFLLNKNSYAVLTNDSALFAERFPTVAIAGVFSGSLRKTGASITILGADSVQWLECSYDNTPPWPAMAAGEGYSLVLTGEDCRTAVSWSAGNVLGGNPGKADIAAYNVQVVVNEVLPGTGGWLELANHSVTNVDISGWYLSMIIPYTLPMTIPSGTIVPAQGYLVLDAHNYLGSFFPALTGGRIFLIQVQNGSTTGYAAGLKYPALADSQTAGITTLSDGTVSMGVLSEATPGAANASPDVGPLVITQLMYHPPIGGYEYLEITNIGTSTVLLADTVDSKKKWTMKGVNISFPAGDTVAPGAKIVLVNSADASDSTFRAKYSVPATVPIYEYTGKLSNSTETIIVKFPVRKAIGSASYSKGWSDVVTYADTLPWPVKADGKGKCLIRKDLTLAGSDPAAWVAGNPSTGK